MSILLLLQIQLIGFVVPAIGLGQMLPHEFQEGDGPIPIFVSQIESRKINIAYDYYDSGPCKPEKYPYVIKNWGEALAGERWAYSPYEVTLKTKFDPKKEKDPT